MDGLCDTYFFHCSRSKQLVEMLIFGFKIEKDVFQDENMFKKI